MFIFKSFLYLLVKSVLGRMMMKTNIEIYFLLSSCALNIGCPAEFRGTEFPRNFPPEVRRNLSQNSVKFRGIPFPRNSVSVEFRELEFR